MLEDDLLKISTDIIRNWYQKELNTAINYKQTELLERIADSLELIAKHTQTLYLRYERETIFKRS